MRSKVDCFTTWSFETMNSILFAPSGKPGVFNFQEISNFVSSFKIAHGKEMQTSSGTVIIWKEYNFFSYLHFDKANHRFF